MNKVKFIKLKKVSVVKIEKQYFTTTPSVGSKIIINGKHYYEIKLADLKKLGYVEEKKIEGVNRVLNNKLLLAA